MTTTQKAIGSFIADLQKEAGQERINALGREMLKLLARYGFHPPTSAPKKKPANSNKAAQPKNPAPPIDSKKEPPENTDAWRVLKAIRDNSGILVTSADVKTKADAVGSGKPIKIKTFRTSLRRLELRKLIWRSGGRWHGGG
jgi:hypothetical protein